MFGTTVVRVEGLLNNCMIGSWRRLMVFFFRRLYDHSISLDFEDSMVWLESKPFPHDIVWNS